MIGLLLASVLAVSAVQDTVTALPGTPLRFGMESGRFGAAQGFQPAPGAQPGDLQHRAGPMRFFGIEAQATLSFQDRRLVQADFVIEQASPQQIAYIGDDLARRGYRRSCMILERDRSQCTWLGAARVEMGRSGARITATIRPRERRPEPPRAEEPAVIDAVPGSAPAVAGIPDTMTILPGVIVGDSVNAHFETRGFAAFPDAARRAGVQGVVRVLALVDTTGAVIETKMARSIPELDEAARAAARESRFRPWTAGGRRVAAWVEIPFRFTIH